MALLLHCSCRRRPRDTNTPRPALTRTITPTGWFDWLHAALLLRFTLRRARTRTPPVLR